MNRSWNDILLRDVFLTIRKIIPEATLRTTFIVGFPGESEKHFQQLLNFVKEIEFNHVATFVFSPEPGTPAAEMPDQIDKELAQQRYERLMETQKKIVSKHLSQKLGKKEKVLLEYYKGKDKWIGRIEGQAPEVDSIVYVKKVPPQIKSGTFAYVVLKDKTDYDFKSEWISNEDSK
jgi:ribosomal protein S12 methylthiotransferase